jgi:hypothetical protein
MSVTTPEARRIYPGIDQLTLRTLIVLGAAAAVVAAQTAGARVGPWEQGIVFGLAVITAIRPESVAGIALLGGAAYLWVLAPETLSPLVLVAAGGMILAHVSALVAAQGPARMAVDGAQVRRWAARGLLLWVVAAAVWGFSVVLADLAQGRLAYALGLIFLTVGALGAIRLLGSRTGN